MKSNRIGRLVLGIVVAAATVAGCKNVPSVVTEALAAEGGSGRCALPEAQAALVRTLHAQEGGSDAERVGRDLAVADAMASAGCRDAAAAVLDGAEKRILAMPNHEPGSTNKINFERANALAAWVVQMAPLRPERALAALTVYSQSTNTIHFAKLARRVAPRLDCTQPGVKALAEQQVKLLLAHVVAAGKEMSNERSRDKAMKYAMYASPALTAAAVLDVRCAEGTHAPKFAELLEGLRRGTGNGIHAELLGPGMDANIAFVRALTGDPSALAGEKAERGLDLVADLRDLAAWDGEKRQAVEARVRAWLADAPAPEHPDQVCDRARDVARVADMAPAEAAKAADRLWDAWQRLRPAEKSSWRRDRPTCLASFVRLDSALVAAGVERPGACERIDSHPSGSWTDATAMERERVLAAAAANGACPAQAARLSGVDAKADPAFATSVLVAMIGDKPVRGTTIAAR
ncbi:MAG: hypothetical protein FJ087_23030 [Deltaproteobacteria bacterium]|nr:hypothetical protein [Deltaproteobacteria bacterium]